MRHEEFLMQYEEDNRAKEVSFALLSKVERDWLLGNVQASKSFEYKMKGNTRRKVQTLFEFDVPLLVKKLHVLWRY